MNWTLWLESIVMAKLIWCLVICLWLESAWGSQEVMMNMAKGFGAALEGCKQELNTGEHIMKDFFNFWREEYDLVNRDLGCMLICMAQKLGLMDADMKMHHGNAEDFAQKHGADEGTAKQLVTVCHECEKASESVEDHCSRVLEMAKCFRTKIHELNWAPSMAVVMEEMMNA